LEAYLGSEPLTPENPRWSSTSYSNGELILRWTKRNGYRGIEATADWSSRVTPWIPAAATIANRTDVFVPLGYTAQEAKVAIPRGVTQRFLELNLTAP
jgi:hypothetical protein